MLGVDEPLCAETYMCQCWRKKRVLGTCVFAERLRSRCVQIYVQLHLQGTHPSPVFPESTPALFSTESQLPGERSLSCWHILEGGGYPFSWSFPGYLLPLPII